MRPFGTIRFMDWGATNGNPLQKWSERPTLDDARWSGDKGVPIEAMIDLCNQTRSNLWMTLPHLADDDYIKRAAESVKTRLAPRPEGLASNIPMRSGTARSPSRNTPGREGKSCN